MSTTSTNPAASGVTRGRYSVSLLGSLRANLEGLQGYGVMALELVQNADDAGAESIVFDVTDDALLVRNSAAFSNCGRVGADRCAWKGSGDDGEGATCDFHRITRVASGGKRHDPENIGRFGIGFVSVYQITDRPQIASSGVRLVLIPEEETFEVRREDSTEGTLFTLPWARDADSVVRRELGASAVVDGDLDDLSRQITEILGHGLLFLKHVTKAEVRRNGERTWVCRVDRKPGTGLLTVETMPGGRSEAWLVLRADAEARAAPLRERYPRLEEARRSTTVSVAIPLAPTDSPSGIFYAYLPTEQATGLPLHINADFYPEPDRRSITLSGGKHQQAWNEALIASAADRLAAELPELPRFLSPEQLWALLAAANDLHDGAEKRQAPACMSAFWPALEAALAARPAVCWTSHEQWIPCDRAFLSRSQYDPDQVRALRALGIELTHPRLRPYQNVLLKAKVPWLTLAVVVGRLSETAALEELAAEAPVPGEVVQRRLHPLWAILEDLLSRASGDTASRSALTRQPLALLDDGTLRAPADTCRLPPWLDRESVLAVLPSLPVAGEAFCEYPALAGLAEPLTLGSLVTHLESRIQSSADAERELGTEPGRLRGFYRLCADLAAADSSPADLDRLAALPVFRGGEGFVSAASAVLPGDFTDPLGITHILDREYYDAVALEFLTSRLEVPKQSLGHFIRTQLPAFFESGPTPERYERLLTELARHSELLEDAELLSVLRGLRMVPTQDGEWDLPREVYHHTEDLETLLGSAPAWWLDESRVPNGKAVSILLDHLGVRREPAAQHLVGRLSQLTEDDPTPDVQKASEALFYAICEHFDRWQEEDGEDLEALEELKHEAVLPAADVHDQWFAPWELHAPYRMEAFRSQVPVLPFRNTRRLKPEALEFLGFTMEPETSVVVAHLRHCASQEKPVSQLVYQVLAERAEVESARELLASLGDEPCIYDPERQRYLRPGQLFWTTPHLGEHAFRVPRQLESYRPFLEVIGVKDEPSAEDCLSILEEIAERFGDTGEELPPDEAAVVRACLSTIARSVEREPQGATGLLTAMREIPCVLNVRNELCYPDEVVLRDSEWHAAPFGEALDQLLVEPDPDMRVLHEGLRIRPLSEVATPVVEYRAGERAEPDLQSRLRERADLLLRLLQDQPSRVRGALYSALASVEVTACTKLRAQFRLETGDVKIPSPAQPARAVYDRDCGVLFVATPVDETIWAEVFKAVFHVMVPAGGGLDLPSRVYIAKQLMLACSHEEAARELSEAGIGEIEFERERIPECGPTSAELGGIGSTAEEAPEDDDGAEADDFLADDPTPEGEGGMEPAEPEREDPAARRVEGSDGRASEKVGGGNGGAVAERYQPRRSGGTREGSGGGSPETDSGAQARRRRTARRKDRLRSYVAPRGRDAGADREDPEGDNAHEYAVEDAARSAVCRYELERGRVPEEMSRTHPGFDIRSYDRAGNLVRLIEVKGIDGEWNRLGVGMRRPQFLHAQEEGDLYWLYVVEFARDPTHATVHAIQNPAFRVDEFFFDTNWRALAEPRDAAIHEAFRPGARIRHHTLMGNGTIVEVIDRGASRQLVVDFDHGGRRLIAFNLAQMELLLDEEKTSDGSDVP